MREPKNNALSNLLFIRLPWCQNQLQERFHSLCRMTPRWLNYTSKGKIGPERKKHVLKR